MKNAQKLGDWVTLSHSEQIDFVGAKHRGVWYWRVCAVSRSGEDDVCKFSGPTYRFWILAPK
jgi:hypothetical protein